MNARVCQLEILERRLDLNVELYDPSLRFNIDRTPRLDLGDASDPRRRCSD